MTANAVTNVSVVIADRPSQRGSWRWEQVRWRNDWRGSAEVFVGFDPERVQAVAVLPASGGGQVEVALLAGSYVRAVVSDRLDVWARFI